RILLGPWTLPELLLLPKPCSTRKAPRFSPGLIPSGTRTVPASFSPADGMMTDSSCILFSPLAAVAVFTRPHPEEARKRRLEGWGRPHASRRSLRSLLSMRPIESVPAKRVQSRLNLSSPSSFQRASAAASSSLLGHTVDG